jgi:aconitate hydratase
VKPLNAWGDTAKVKPAFASRSVIDHSALPLTISAMKRRLTRMFASKWRENHERYVFLKWGQQAFSRFSVVPQERDLPSGQP